MIFLLDIEVAPNVSPKSLVIAYTFNVYDSAVAPNGPIKTWCLYICFNLFVSGRGVGEGKFHVTKHDKSIYHRAVEL